MHTYSIGGGKDNLRGKIIIWLFCMSIIICTLVNLLIDVIKKAVPAIFCAIDKFFLQWPWLGISLSSISAFAIFGLLFWLFDNYWWKCSLIQKYTKILDYSGTWKGYLVSSYDLSKKINMEAVIKQTWSKISIRSKFGNTIANETSSSFSDSAYIDPEHILGSLLKFTYANRAMVPSWEVREHRGENELFLKYDEVKKQYMELRGDYFNNRGQRGNVGNITLSRCIKKIGKMV
jgi:hypothetical protein